MPGKGRGSAPADGRDVAIEDDDLEAAYCAEYLRDCADGDAREERLAELRRRIAQHAYRVDTQTLADELIRRLRS
jgi:anti-sigma28 factor (negative regulator of flagellin synthesis)